MCFSDKHQQKHVRLLACVFVSKICGAMGHLVFTAIKTKTQQQKNKNEKKQTKPHQNVQNFLRG